MIFMMMIMISVPTNGTDTDIDIGSNSDDGDDRKDLRIVCDTSIRLKNDSQNIKNGIK